MEVGVTGLEHRGGFHLQAGWREQRSAGQPEVGRCCDDRKKGLLVWNINGPSAWRGSRNSYAESVSPSQEAVRSWQINASVRAGANAASLPSDQPSSSPTAPQQVSCSNQLLLNTSDSLLEPSQQTHICSVSVGGADNARGDR